MQWHITRGYLTTSHTCIAFGLWESHLALGMARSITPECS